VCQRLVAWLPAAAAMPMQVPTMHVSSCMQNMVGGTQQRRWWSAEQLKELHAKMHGGRFVAALHAPLRTCMRLSCTKENLLEQGWANLENFMIMRLVSSGTCSRRSARQWRSSRPYTTDR
jgi:hypothetical protein